MSEQIAMIEAPVYEVAGAEVPRVLHAVADFDLLGARCRVRSDAEGQTLFLRVGQRDFAVSLLDLAATAALAVEGHIKGEIRARILGRRPAQPTPPSDPNLGVQPVQPVALRDPAWDFRPRPEAVGIGRWPAGLDHPLNLKPRESVPPEAAPGIQQVPLRGEVEADGFITLYPTTPRR